MARREAYITLKYHKDNFSNSLPFRLINPAKSEMGLVKYRLTHGLCGGTANIRGGQLVSPKGHRPAGGITAEGISHTAKEAMG